VTQGSISDPIPHTGGWLFVALLLLGSIVALTGLRQFFIEPLATRGVNVTWFVIQLLPLLAPLPGLLRLKLRSIFVLCMTSTLYFIHGVLLVFDPNMQLMGGFEIFFALGLTAVAALLVRKIRESEAGSASQ
jgi:uncharacterized membrane protein